MGFLDLESPYLQRSSVAMVKLFRSAVKNNLSPEFYGYLDGVYAVHANQQPLDSDNICGMLSKVSSDALVKGLSPLFLACARSSGARGFNTYRGGSGKIVSGCTMPQVRIRDLSALAARFRKPHPILSHSSFSIRFMKQRKIPEVIPSEGKDPPPLVLFASQSPYGTEMTRGALSLALACAHAGILTRVVFIEEGIYTLVGHHAPDEDETVYNLQSLIESTSDRENLEYYSYIPSFQKRGLMGSNTLKCVVPLGTSAIAKMLFLSPQHIEAEQQRAIIF
jgi:tRNA 2-thiouridine synthesizing protein C